jgi:putative membrane protein
LRTLLLLSTLVGLALAATLLGSVGLAPVLAAVGRIGYAGFAVFTLYTLLVLGVLGAAWWAVAPGLSLEALPSFVWGRMTREAATDLLPFAQIGGLVVGGRTVTATGIPAPLAYASMTADLTTEMAAQLVFTLAGVVALTGMISGGPAADHTRNAVLVGLTLVGLVGAAFAFAQRPLIALAGRLLEGLLPGTAVALAAVRHELDAIYRERARLLLSFALNLAAWLLSAGGAWLALRLAGQPVPLLTVLVIESLIFALHSAAFMVPGALGIQEGAYVLLCPLFGLPPELGLALSLLKRARDLAIAVPVLLVWQAREGGALWRRAVFRRAHD